MKANFPRSLQHMQKEPVSKATGIFCMSSMWSELGKGGEDRACVPPRLQSIPVTHHRIPTGQNLLESSSGAAAVSNCQQQVPCAIGVLVLIWRSSRWEVFTPASPVNFRDHIIPQKSNTDIRRPRIQAGLGYSFPVLPIQSKLTQTRS